MNLRIVTLLAAITQLLAALWSVVSYVRIVAKWGWTSENAEYLVAQPIYLLSHIMLAVFLFTLVARQQRN